MRIIIVLLLLAGLVRADDRWGAAQTGDKLRITGRLGTGTSGPKPALLFGGHSGTDTVLFELKTTGPAGAAVTAERTVTVVGTIRWAHVRYGDGTVVKVRVVRKVVK
jgi:hypothetical protein